MFNAAGAPAGPRAVRADPRFKPLPPEPATLLDEGRLSEAIRTLRESQGIGTRKARQWIDWHIEQHPMLRVQLETLQRARRRRMFLWFLLADAAIVAVVIYYLMYLKN